MDDAVIIGVIGRPHGTRGAVRAVATGATLGTLGPGDEVLAQAGDGPVRPLVVEGRAGTAQRPILTFAGVGTREQAAALTGATLRVPGERVVVPDDPDTYFVSDLVGCEVVVGERPAGRVTAVHGAPANDVLEVAGPEGPVLVPFTADAVTGLDLAARRIVVRADLFGG